MGQSALQVLIAIQIQARGKRGLAVVDLRWRLAEDELVGKSVELDNVVVIQQDLVLMAQTTTIDKMCIRDRSSVARRAR